MSKRVAITIAGAVSLGSYEAGVTYELLEALRAHNEAAVNNDTKIYVDVITGASAGGMTAAMLAQWLIFRGKSMSGPTTNPLYHAWVERVSLKGLVLLQRGEGVFHSLFSSNLIRQIGKEMLMDAMLLPPTGMHACLEPEEPVRVGVALTNLNGLDYMIPIVGSDEGGFNYTRSADQRLFVVREAEMDGPTVLTPDGKEWPVKWDELRDGAVGSGAFPFAFRPQGINRNKDEFVNAVTPEWPGKGKPTVEGTTYVEWGDEPTEFAYSDGGVLQNQPLGIAKKLVNMSVKERLTKAKAMLSLTAQKSAHKDADERLYVFISPNEVKSSAVELKADKINMRKMLPDLMATYMRQATFHDWIMAEGVNEDVRLLDKRAEELANALEGGAITNLECFKIASDNLNELLLATEPTARSRAQGETGSSLLNETLERLRHQYDKLYNGLKQRKSLALAEIFISGIATLEAAAQLHDTDKMHIVAVLADGKKELAGSGMSAFVGFFSRTFREHDYLVGRKKARAYLQRTDVTNLLQLNTKAVEANWAAGAPLGDPEKMLRVPLSLPAMLRPAFIWLLYAVLLRTWPIVLVLLALLYWWLAGHFHWWPR